MKECLGVLFERRDDGAFVLSQRQYLLNILQRFGMEDCKPCATPFMPKETIDEASTDTSNTTFPFREAVGSLLYLATHTRPDISRLECWAAPWLHQVLRMLSLSSD
jgi:hypothetical protein